MRGARFGGARRPSSEAPDAPAWRATGGAAAPLAPTRRNGVSGPLGAGREAGRFHGARAGGATPRGGGRRGERGLPREGGAVRPASSSGAGGGRSEGAERRGRAGPPVRAEVEREASRRPAPVGAAVCSPEPCARGRRVPAVSGATGSWAAWGRGPSRAERHGCPRPAAGRNGPRGTGRGRRGSAIAPPEPTLTGASQRGRRAPSPGLAQRRGGRRVHAVPPVSISDPARWGGGMIRRSSR